MLKKDLESGNVVLFRNGKKALVIKNEDSGVFLYGRDVMSLDGWEDDMLHKRCRGMDILKV